MIVGTAGHIDHGKTSLVRSLTGVDTDRLAEEKARGISIELGYAYVPVEAAGPGDPVLGFVDVPGHERFVHTMVAGAGSIDFALLVVAADDGVMPQTREHLAILDLLDVERGAVALSKSDRVDAARIGKIAAEVTALLASTALRDAPLFPLVATDPDDACVARLRRHLHEVAAQTAMRTSRRLFRFAIDRVFTLAGHGTIVTGIVRDGTVTVGDTVTLLPGSIPVRVRNIHAQNRESPTGRAGQRCALNLAGIATDALARGDWLADARTLHAAERIDVRVRLLAGAGPLRDGMPVHVHVGAAHHHAHAFPLAGQPLAAGASGLVQLVFDQPCCALPGDRFILRDAQAAHTIGGGVTLDPHAPARKRRSAARLAWLGAIERMLAEGSVAPLLAQAPEGIALDRLAALSGLAPELLDTGPALRIATPAGIHLFDAAHWQGLRARAVEALQAFHAQQPDEAGIDSGRLRRRVAPSLAAAPWRAIVDALVTDHAVARSGAWLHLPEHRVELDETEQALLQKLQPLLAAGRFDPPWVRDLATASGTDEALVRRLLRKAAALGGLHQVVRDLFYARESIEELAAILRALAAQGPVQAARYRDATGIGRKRTVQLLEYFDRIGYTRRVRDAHILRTDSGWQA